MQDKRCPSCGEVKAIKDFASPRLDYCRPCSNKRITEWRHKQRAAVLEARGPVVPRTEKSCKRCGIIKPFSEFYPAKTSFSTYCKPCFVAIGMERRTRLGPQARAAEKLRYKAKRSGATADWFVAQMKEQNGLCAICKTAEIHPVRRGGLPRSLAIDHDHKTGKPRGLLCFRCNTSVHLLDKYGLEWAAQAVRYIESSRKD
jgi:hypothetical protein